MPRISYINGRYLAHHDASISIDDRAFLFSDSVYEVCAIINGIIADEVGHLDRLWRSMTELQIHPPHSRGVLKLIMREVLRRNRLRNASLYIQVTRGSAARDFKFPSQNVGANLIMVVRPAHFDREMQKQKAQKAYTTPDLRWRRRDIKSTSLLAQVLAKQFSVDKGGYEAFLVDENGYITEGASSNIWIVKNNELITRPTEHNMILKGVTRHALQKLAITHHLKITERAFTVDECLKADEVFTSSAVALFVPITMVDNQMIGTGKIGAITSKIIDYYFDYTLNQNEQFHWDPK